MQKRQTTEMKTVHAVDLKLKLQRRVKIQSLARDTLSRLKPRAVESSLTTSGDLIIAALKP